MKIDGLNRWLTLAANIGVVIGIAFLVVEINQNTVSTRIAARNSATQGHINYIAHMLDSSVLASAAAKTWVNQEPSHLETTQLLIFHEIRWRHYEGVFYLYQNDVISGQEWTGYESGIAQSFQDDDVFWKISRDSWEMNKAKLSEDFTAYVEELVADLR
jgi:hypothetical protein